MRDRILADLSDLNGVQWVALIGPEALPISIHPHSDQAENAAAMWLGLEARAEVLLGGVPEKFTLRSDSAIMLSHRVDLGHIILMRADVGTNLGGLRNSINDAAELIGTFL
ncbi:MAG: hypothetical protein QF440_06190 [Candidatus Thalassarchaeaceae archaeon]|nr:hypothetical protein [Candidatus Thalassarchaeaceae archaeon]